MFQPEALVVARQRRGLKKTALARLLGIKPDTLTSYENGTTTPDAKLVTKMATVLSFPETFFQDELVEPINAEGVSFRALSRMSAKQRDAALASGALCVRFNWWLENYFEFPRSSLLDLDPAFIDPESAADKLRGLWLLGNMPIDDLLYLVESNGVRVFALADECREVDAFSFWYGDVPFICVTTDRSPERVIFDIAHEVGHLVMHRGHGSPRGRDEEHEANRFASAFLMPEADVRSHVSAFPTFPELVRAKTRWRVSVAALNYRLHKLGVLSDWHYRENCIEISGFGRAIEPNSVTFPQSSVLTTALAVMRDEKKGRAAIASDLNLSVADFDGLIRGLAVTAFDGGAETVPSARPELRIVR